jgi:hypothetical protein
MQKARRGEEDVPPATVVADKAIRTKSRVPPLVGSARPRLEPIRLELSRKPHTLEMPGLPHHSDSAVD